MGDFFSNPVTPTLYEDKEPAPGQTLRPGWTTRNVPTAQNLTDIKNALLDLREGTRPLLLEDGGPIPVLATGSTTARTAAARFADVANVLDYGAVGDGVADDTAAINAALAAAVALGGSGAKAVVPPGTYRINTDYAAGHGIRLRSGVRLVFEPGAILQAIPTANPVGAVIYGLGVSDCIVEGGEVVGERDGHLDVTGEHGMGVRLDSCTRVTLRDMRIRDCWGDGVYVGSQSGGASNQDTHIENVEVLRARRNGISIVDGVRGTIRDCRLLETNGIAPQAGIDFEPAGGVRTATDWLVTGCHFEDNAERGLTIYDTCARIHVIGNTFIHNGTEQEVYTAAEDCIIKGNMVQAQNSGIFANVGADRCIIEGNVVRHTANYGIRVLDSDDCVVAGNTLEGAGFAGVFVGTASLRARVANNTCNGQRTGIQVEAGSDSAQVLGNLVKGGITGGITVDTCRLCTVQGNTVQNLTSTALAGILLTPSTAAVSGFHRVQGNTVHDVPKHGIICDAPDSTVESNLVVGASAATNLGANALYVSSSTAARVTWRNNTVRSDTAIANRPAYGLVLVSGASLCMHEGNDFTGGPVTGEVSNSATGTVGGRYRGIDGVLREGFYGIAPKARIVVSGAKGGNAALASLMAALASAGINIVSDNTTA
jgi:parallel beta-helix repeat protein